MQYYKMVSDGGPKRQNDVVAKPRTKVKDEYILFEGTAINNWNNDMTFECDFKEGYVVTEYLCNVCGWDIFSEKAIRLFGDLISNDIQLLPIKVINKDTGREIDKYFVVNIIPFLDALDLENSVYDYCGDDLSVIKYGIKEEKVGRHHIFRLKDSQFSAFVSEEFYKIAKKNKMVGCDFLKVKTG
ncbi:MAG: hypothetical protein LBC70_05625 [Chitinispirillales bacterium]|jgi:hypothetical protein|nr:hypothetical protein [Chitinispirillales bacterium]